MRTNTHTLYTRRRHNAVLAHRPLTRRPLIAGAPDEVLNPKKKVFEAVQPDLASNAQCVACYRGVPFTTSAGPCRVATIAGGTIR